MTHKFTIELDTKEAEALVELSHQLNDNDPAKTIRQLIFLELRTFLCGKVEGMQQGGKLAIHSIDKAIDKGTAGK